MLGRGKLIKGVVRVENRGQRKGPRGHVVHLIRVAFLVAANTRLSRGRGEGSHRLTT